MARVLISMPEKFLDEIDQIADTENRSREKRINIGSLAGLRISIKKITEKYQRFEESALFRRF